MKTPKSKCPVCKKNKANYSVLLKSVMPCNACDKRREENELPDHQVEMTSKEIKEGRWSHAKSALQPWRHHEASREFLEAHPEDAKKMFTKKEIRNAKNVWSDVPSIRNWKNSR